jgi:hypothetical protein
MFENASFNLYMINLNMVSDYGTSVGALASKDFLGETWV